MASLHRVRTHGYSYWRIVESRRVNGKPRPVPVCYLGTADDLLKRLLAQPQGLLRLRSYEHGAVAALKTVADRVDVVGIIDRHVPRSRHRLSVGTTLLLAALNRAIRPRSKRSWASWAAGTSIARVMPGVPVETLTSQYFWDQMHRVSLPALEAIEEELTRKVVSTVGVPLDTLFYDTTNFFTYIASTNSKPQLPQRGHSKQHRGDLRQVSLALLVTREGQIPLCSHLYEGNRPDAKSFPTGLTLVRERLERLVGALQDLTLVYDKGNHSRANQAQVDGQAFHYVASLGPHHHRDLVALPVRAYSPIQEAGPLQGVLAYRLERELWGVKRTIVLYLSEQLRAGQIRGLEQQLQKRLRHLQAWQETLARPRSGPKTAHQAQQRIRTLLMGQFIKDVLRVEYRPERTGSARLQWTLDEDARRQLETEWFGKRLLMSDRHDWSTAEIIRAYRGQSQAEAAFRQLKDPDHLAVRPQYHWTDQKIRVHTFCCLLALLLCRILERTARQAGFTQDLSSLLELLGQVRLAMVLRPAGDQGGRPRCDWRIEDAPAEALRLYHLLVPKERQLVYTPSS
jgi:transposase